MQDLLLLSLHFVDQHLLALDQAFVAHAKRVHLVGDLLADGGLELPDLIPLLPQPRITGLVHLRHLEIFGLQVREILAHLPHDRGIEDLRNGGHISRLGLLVNRFGSDSPVANVVERLVQATQASGHDVAAFFEIHRAVSPCELVQLELGGLQAALDAGDLALQVVLGGTG